jgi:leucyl-tRNA synthetase
MGGWIDSSWYFLRYCDPKNKKKAFDNKKVRYWMPVDQYIGGAEHAVMHLIYARFFVKALKDLGIVKFDEPFLKLFNQGVVYKDGAKMSKSKGNVVTQEEISKKYGIDTARLFLMFVASPDKDVEWTDEGIEGSLRFVKKLAGFNKFGKTSRLVESKLNKTIKQVTENIENFQYNLAVINLREFFESIEEEGISKKDFSIFLKLLSPFCPHICEELWHKLGNKSFISLERWPKAGKINEKLLKQEEQIEKLIEDIRNILKILKQRGEKKKLIKIFAVPSEVKVYEKGKARIGKSFGLKVEIMNIKDAKVEGKKIKAKPGKPGILIE